MAAGDNRFAPELNEKEVVELLEDLSKILGANHYSTRDRWIWDDYSQLGSYLKRSRNNC